MIRLYRFQTRLLVSQLGRGRHFVRILASTRWLRALSTVCSGSGKPVGHSSAERGLENGGAPHLPTSSLPRTFAAPPLGASPCVSSPASPDDWDRGGKTKATALSPLYASIRKLLDENKGNVCFVQVGSFYELYFEQATLIAPQLGIKVATRQTSNHKVPMAGFPVGQLQKNVKILVHDLHLNVAIVDQYQYVCTETDLKHRRVSRIVSPGTLVDESFMNFAHNNYLVAVSVLPNVGPVVDPDTPVGLLWADISVGEFYVQQTCVRDLPAELTRISPSEVILPKALEDHAHTYDIAGLFRRYFVRYHRASYTSHKLPLAHDSTVPRRSVERFSLREQAAVNLILSYMAVNLPDRALQLGLPTRFVNERFLAMDARTRHALELSGRSTAGSISKVGTLWLVVRRTVTASGTRLLAQWLNLPLVDEAAVRERHDYVALLKDDHILRTRVTATLRDMGDLARAVQKLALRSGSAVAHLHSIADGLRKLQRLLSVLRDAEAAGGDRAHLVGRFLATFSVPADVEAAIGRTLVDDAPKPEVGPEIGSEPEEPKEPAHELQRQLVAAVDSRRHTADLYQSTGRTGTESILTHHFCVRRDYDSITAALHNELDALVQFEKRLFADLQRLVALVDPKGSVNRRDRIGKHFHVMTVQCAQKNSARAFAAIEQHGDFVILERRKQSVLVKPVHWAEILEKRDAVRAQLAAHEHKVVERLRSRILARVTQIRDAARCADVLDVLSAFARVAYENNWVRPIFCDAPVLEVTRGRHPVVEPKLRDNSVMFAPNDTQLDSDSLVWVILGPNMGGKSTFLRQNALLVILAQMGAFVPAQHARLGMVDRLFTRIGADDDIYSDMSTFMLEMTETSNILAHATARSLAIVDEIGRGTSSNEGLAIAYATLVTLATHNRCRTLFATHYGPELKRLLDRDGVDTNLFRFFQTKVSTDGALRFDHTLSPGLSERSYAFEIAQMAGFPANALEHATRAQRLLGLGEAVKG